MQNKSLTICSFSDITEKYSVSNPVSSPVSWLPQIPSVLMNFHLLRGQKPLNRKFPTSSTDMLCGWSSAVLFHHLCCIYLFTHKMMRNIMDAESKHSGALGTLLSNITSPLLHSTFISVVIHIYYFPSSFSTAWQCSRALGPVAGEAEAAKNTKRRNALLHIQASPDHPPGRDFSQLPITKWRIFFFLLLRCTRPDFWVLISTCRWVCESLWARSSCWQVPLERWWLEVAVWNHRIFPSETASWILKSARASS